MQVFLRPGAHWLNQRQGSSHEFKLVSLSHLCASGNWPRSSHLCLNSIEYPEPARLTI